MGFALKDLTKDQKAVLFQINFNSDKGLFEMSSGFTAFPGEDEILI